MSYSHHELLNITTPNCSVQDLNFKAKDLQHGFLSQGRGDADRERKYAVLQAED